MYDAIVAATVQRHSTGRVTGRGVETLAASSFWRATSAALLAAAIVFPAPAAATGLQSTISDAFIGWSSTIEYRALGGPSGASGGAIELLVDNAVWASCPANRNYAAPCYADGVSAGGSHSVGLRFIPSDTRYGSTTLAYGTYPGLTPVPPESGILVAGGAFSTQNRDVSINPALIHPDGGQVVAVRLSHSANTDADGNLTDAAEFPWTSGLNWQLPGGADGARTVWAQLKNGQGEWSSPVSDSVYLDTTSPSGSFVLNNDAPTIGDAWSGTIYDQSVTGSVTDATLAAGGKISHMALSNDGQHWRVDSFASQDPAAFETLWQFYFAWGAANHQDPGIKTVYAKWRDEAGNWSPVVTDTIRYIDETGVGQTVHRQRSSRGSALCPRIRLYDDRTTQDRPRRPPCGRGQVDKGLWQQRES